MVSKLEVPEYSGWRPRAMRAGRNKHEAERKTKRSRLGKAKDRTLYKSAKGHKTDPVRFAQLSERARRLNGNKMGSAKIGVMQ